MNFNFYLLSWLNLSLSLQLQLPLADCVGFYKKQVKHVYVMGITVVILINSNSFLMIFYPLYYFVLCFIQVLYCYTPVLIFSFV